MNPFTVRKDLTKIQPVSKSTDLKIIYSGKPLKETNMKIGKALELDATIVGKTDAEFTDIYRYVKFPKKAKIIIIYIYFRNVRSPCLDPWIPGSMDPSLRNQTNFQFPPMGMLCLVGTVLVK